MRDEIETKIQNGEKVKNLINDETFIKAINDTKDALREAWEIESDSKERDKVWYILRAIGCFEQTLQATLDNGEIAKTELENIIKGY